jgi:hypothetical protein
MSILTDEERQAIVDISGKEIDMLYGQIINRLDELQNTVQHGVPVATNVMVTLSEQLLANVMANCMNNDHRNSILGGYIVGVLVAEQRILGARKAFEEANKADKECMN